MGQTRQVADRLLAAGQVERAERYMDRRRDALQQHGYTIRKLNQAYFAFYGSYTEGVAASPDQPAARTGAYAASAEPVGGGVPGPHSRTSRPWTSCARRSQAGELIERASQTALPAYQAHARLSSRPDPAVAVAGQA